MIPRNSDSSHPQLALAHELGSGLVTVRGFAQLAADHLGMHCSEPLLLSVEAQVLLAIGKRRGIFEIRGQANAFDSTERLLAVAVEYEEGRWKIFRKKSEPEKTVGFLDGFRELCVNGLAIHHFQSEFSLSRLGFDMAKKVCVPALESYLEWALDWEC